MHIDIYGLTEEERTCLLTSCLEYLSDIHSRGKYLKNSQDTQAFLQMYYRTHQQEVFGCIYLTTRNRVIALEELFFGTIDGAAVYPREVVKRALAHNASALILFHNHPSGVSEPSAADRDITKRLQEALALVDVRVVDHLVASGGGCTSMAEQGLL